MIGKSLSHFTVTAKLGEGGMGEVYRATDTRLGREVAIKVLPEAFVVDAERLARFEREARLLASLSHPRIAGIFEVGVQQETHFLVMELAEGESLAARIRRGPLAPDEALSIALQIAEGLEQAHERGIVHRDLKPGNLMVAANGSVKILDFGLAKAWDDPGRSDLEATQAPTLTAQMTRPGVVLGTAAYMSPEQASGEEADKRSDIWSFGVVLAEMLTGRRLFEAPSVSATLAAVLRDPVALDRLPEETPEVVRLLLARCLERQRPMRLRDIGEARIALQAAVSPGGSAPLLAAAASEGAGNDPRRSRMPWLLASLALVALSTTALWIRALAAPDAADPAVARLALPLPSDQQLVIGEASYPLALSADGGRLAYVAAVAGESSLFVRELDSFAARPLPDTAGARYPFFSPDGEWLGFFADGMLKRILVRGGPPSSLCEAEPVRGASWAADGYIYFSRHDGQGGLERVAAAGGPPEVVRTGQEEFDESLHFFPHALPDGSGLLTHLGPREGRRNTEQNKLALLDLESQQWRLLGNGTQAQYVDPGFLIIHLRRGELRAVRFDLERREVQGQPLPVMDGVYRAPSFGGAFFAASRNGTLVYLPGGFERQLRRVARDGRETPLVDEIRGFRLPRLSPDGRHLAVVIDPRPSEVWVYDLETGARNRLTHEDHSLVPVWSPDGQRIGYSSGGDLHTVPADGSESPAAILQRPGAQYPGSWSPDGRHLVYWDNARDSWDIWATSAEGEPFPVAATSSHEWNARISPDGRWLAYQSDASGRWEVYAQSFPDGLARRPLSTGGGRNPVWAADGSEIFYHDGASVFAVSIRSGAQLESGRPKVLFDWPHGLVHSFDVFPAGESFAMVKTDPDTSPDKIRVVLHWARELRAEFSPQRSREPGRL